MNQSRALSTNVHGLMPSAELTFSVAGLIVQLQSSQVHGLDSLDGYYRHYECAGSTPDVVIEFETTSVANALSPPMFPKFASEWLGDHQVRFVRRDAEGLVVLPSRDGVLRAQFQGANIKNTIEAVIRISIGLALIYRGGTILHASGVVAHGQSHVFAGLSGAGKSTLSTLLAESEATCRKISDELIILSPDSAGVWRAYVTPFLCSEGLPHGESYPVRDIHFLSHATRHERCPMGPRASVRELMRHVLLYASDPSTADCALGVAIGLTRAVPCYGLGFAPDPSVAEVLGIT